MKKRIRRVATATLIAVGVVLAPLYSAYTDTVIIIITR